MQSRKRVERIAHRGAKRELPENSLPAFQRAFERGADAIELDVHATRDGVVVVHHDADLGRYANDLSGVPIADLDSARLATLELAPGVGIPTLAGVLEAVPAGATVYVEIKGASIEQAVADVISRCSAACAVHSFDHAAVARFGALLPAIPRGILIETADVDVAAAMARTGARDVWPATTLVDARFVDHVHGLGGRVIVWTVNSAVRAAELASLGVDGICTDDVRLLDA